MPTAIKLKPVQERLIAKLQTKGLVINSVLGTQPRANPFTGVTVTLEPLALALYDWIVSPSRGDEINAGKLAQNDWDRARYLFLTLWPDDYYSLLD